MNILLALVLFAIFDWNTDKTLTNNFYILYTTLSAFLMGIAGVAFLNQNPAKSSAWTMIGFIASHVLLIQYDIIFDIRSHNLFPFEIGFILVYTFPTSYAGASITSLIMQRIKH